MSRWTEGEREGGREGGDKEWLCLPERYLDRDPVVLTCSGDHDNVCPEDVLSCLLLSSPSELSQYHLTPIYTHTHTHTH